MIRIVSAVAIFAAFTTEAANPDSPPACHFVHRMEPVERDPLRERSARVLRSLAGDVIVQKSSGKRASQTISNRVAEVVRGTNSGREFREVRYRVCESYNPDKQEMK